MLSEYSTVNPKIVLHIVSSKEMSKSDILQVKSTTEKYLCHEKIVLSLCHNRVLTSIAVLGGRFEVSRYQ